MIHYSCDRCGVAINPNTDLRYTVKIEAYAAMDPACDFEEEDERDHLMEIHEILERLDDESDPNIGEEVYQKTRLDLCPECARKFLGDPLGRKASQQFNFSSN